MALLLDMRDAKAVYAALHALASIGAVVAGYEIRIPNKNISVLMYEGGGLGVGYGGRTKEDYADLAAFLKAYRLRAISKKF